jgi:glycosyltransferase involved in cell wall biosynthesis
MRILICHNFYQQAGGEDEVFAAETQMLRRFGHDVQTHSVDNHQIESMGKLKLAAKTIWNGAAAKEIAARVRNQQSEIVHFHNTFPLLSPAVYWAAREAGAAVMQTLHNYRLICPAATLFRDGKPCEKCVGRLPTAAVRHACYRGSRAASAVSAAMLTMNRRWGSYGHKVDAYIALTNFAREKFLEGGFDAGRLHVKGNFLDPDPGEGTGDGGFALFVGRLAEEKGVPPLLSGWERIGGKVPLKICGDGPFASLVRESAAKNTAIEWLGRRKLEEVLELMGRAMMVVVPSIWYEGFPRTIVESFARGTPVIASDLGSMKELIESGRTGELFSPGDPKELAEAVLRLAGNDRVLASMRREARGEFVAKYTAEKNHQLLVEIYQQALTRRNGTGKPEVVAAAS